jgi:hypothetical protein
LRKEFDPTRLLLDGEESINTPATSIPKNVASLPEDFLDERISKVDKKRGLLLRYRDVHGLELTDLKAAILSEITSQKLADAPLKDLITAFKAVSDAELESEGGVKNVKGLVAYLLHIDKVEVTMDKDGEGKVIDIGD